MKLYWDDEYVDDGVLEEIDGYDSLVLLSDQLAVGTTSIKKGGFPYLKIRRVDENDNTMVIGVCRIDVLEPKYITGFNENMVLSNDEIDILCDKLTETFMLDYTINKEISNWDILIDHLAYTGGEKFISDKVYLGMPIPNYKLLKQ